MILLISLEVDSTNWVIHRLVNSHEINKDDDPRKIFLIARIFNSVRYILYKG